MRRSWGVLASVVLAVALEVAIKLVADSVAVPRKYYFVPVGVFVVLVGLQVVLTLRDQQAPGRGRARPAVLLASGRHTIKGRWHPPSLVMVATIVVVASLCLMLGLLPLVRKTPAGLADRGPVLRRAAGSSLHVGCARLPGWRWICLRERSATGWSGCGGRRWRLR